MALSPEAAQRVWIAVLEGVLAALAAALSVVSLARVSSLHGSFHRGIAPLIHQMIERMQPPARVPTIPVDPFSRAWCPFYSRDLREGART